MAELLGTMVWTAPSRVGLNDELIRPVAALKASGLRAYVTGMDGDAQALQAICKPGSMFVATARQQFESFGSLSAEWISEIAGEGEDPHKIIPTRTVYLPAQLFTRADCEAAGL